MSADAPVLSVEGFEGPLDWLVEQARARRIDLARLSIGALIDAFEAALLQAFAAPGLQAASLARWGDWLVMAADLTVLRSRLLVVDPVARHDAEAEAEALRRRLLGRAATAAAASWLERRDQLGRQVFARGQDAAGGRASAGRVGDITGLLRACLVVLALPPGTGPGFAVARPPLWTVADAVARLRQRLGAGEDARFGDCLPSIAAGAPQRPLQCRAAVASTLVGVLELVREGEIAAVQEVSRGPIALSLELSPDSRVRGGPGGA